MSVSKKRQTSSARKRRASHFALKSTSLATCPKCKKPVKPHYACTFCGEYKGKEMIAVRPSKEERELAKKGKVKSKKTIEEKKAKEKK